MFFETTQHIVPKLNRLECTSFLDLSYSLLQGGNEDVSCPTLERHVEKMPDYSLLCPGSIPNTNECHESLQLMPLRRPLSALFCIPAPRQNVLLQHASERSSLPHAALQQLRYALLAFFRPPSSVGSCALSRRRNVRPLLSLVAEGRMARVVVEARVGDCCSGRRVRTSLSQVMTGFGDLGRTLGPYRLCHLPLRGVSGPGSQIPNAENSAGARGAVSRAKTSPAFVHLVVLRPGCSRLW